MGIEADKKSCSLGREEWNVSDVPAPPRPWESWALFWELLLSLRPVSLRFLGTAAIFAVCDFMGRFCVVFVCRNAILIWTKEELAVGTEGFGSGRGLRLVAG